MPPDAVRNSPPLPWRRLALILWSICLLVILARLCLDQPGRRSLYPIYGKAGTNWRAGKDLYPTEKKGYGYPLFRYSPTAAVLLAPFTYLPFRAADLLWRIINWSGLLGSLLGWSRRMYGTDNRSAVGVWLLLILPLAIGNLNNGQSNSLVLAALLAGLAAAAGQRWNWAAVLLAFACLFKVYPLAVGLLMCLLYPRKFAPRWMAALALGAALPFALQDPAYVGRQYALWLHYLRVEDRTGWPVYFSNLDFQLLCRVWLSPIGPKMYTAIQLVSAAAIAVFCLAARRIDPTPRRLLPLVLGLGCIWMTVFGPATESPTYVLLAPTAAGTFLSAWRDRRSLPLRGLLLAVYALLVSAQIVAWFAGLYLPYRAWGPQPVAGLLLAVGLLMPLFHPRLTTRLQSFRNSVAKLCRPHA